MEQGVFLMDIVIGRTSYVSRDAPDNPAESGYQRSRRRDRRRNRQDRRKSVRDGVIVSLSFKNDRRKLKDRRKNSY
jgi:hypothetical protein